MKATIQKWGNSLALRIPRHVVMELGLTEDSGVELTVLDGKFEVCTMSSDLAKFEEMCSRITPENSHPEWDTGPPVGREFW